MYKNRKLYMMTTRRKKRDLNLIPLLGLLIFGCGGPGNSDIKKLSLKRFSCNVEVTDSIQIISQSGDGYDGKLLLNQADTVYFNFGYSIDNLSESDPEVVYYPYDEDSIREKLDTAFIDSKRIVYTRKPNFDMDEFRKQNVEYKTISGNRAKITFPREITKGGITGMYVDSLQEDSGGRLKFNFYAKNLDSLSNQRLIQVFKTVEFSLK